MAFKPFAKDASLLRRVECVIKRHDNEYFVGWTDQQLSALDADVRPSRALDPAEASLVSKNERLLNKKLAWAWVREAAWRRPIREFQIADVGENGSGQSVEGGVGPIWRK